MSYSKIIIKLLESKYPEYVMSYDLEKVNTPWGWIGSSGSRRARELAESNQIEVDYDGIYAKYRAKMPLQDTKNVASVHSIKTITKAPINDFRPPQVPKEYRIEKITGQLGMRI